MNLCSIVGVPCDRERNGPLRPVVTLAGESFHRLQNLQRSHRNLCGHPSAVRSNEFRDEYRFSRRESLDRHRRVLTPYSSGDPPGKTAAPSMPQGSGARPSKPVETLASESFHRYAEIATQFCTVDRRPDRSARSRGRPVNSGSTVGASSHRCRVPISVWRSPRKPRRRPCRTPVRSRPVRCCRPGRTAHAHARAFRPRRSPSSRDDDEDECGVAENGAEKEEPAQRQPPAARQPEHARECAGDRHEQRQDPDRESDASGRTDRIPQRIGQPPQPVQQEKTRYTPRCQWPAGPRGIRRPSGASR